MAAIYVAASIDGLFGGPDQKLGSEQTASLRRYLRVRTH